MQNCQLKLQQQYLEQLIGLSDSLRKFRHDYKNHLFCMDNLLMSGNYDALHKYLMDLHQMPFDNLTFYTYTSSKSVNIIINQKQNIAKAANIDFNLNIDLPDNSNIKELDIVTLLSNLCDNAIEACIGLKDASINIIIKKVKAYLMIEVQNTVRNNILEKNPSLKTSKSDVKIHGFGTKIIKSIAEAYHGFYEVHCTDNLFTSKVLLLEDIDYPEVNVQPVFTDKLRSYKPQKSEAV